MGRVILEASEGMILTNGETFGKKIYLEEGLNGKDFKEITEAEYNELIKKESEFATGV